MSRVNVLFACNDPDNGNLTDRVVGIDITTATLFVELRSPGFPEDKGLTYREHDRDRKVQVGRRRFAHHGMQSWVGNWCWNGAGMGTDEARRLAEYVLSRGWAADQWPTEGPWADLFDEHGRGKKRPAAGEKGRDNGSRGE